MHLHSMYRTIALGLLVIWIGCNDLQLGQDNEPPEEVFRQFMIASLSGEESQIRPRILDHPDMAVLWQGPYPPQVAVLLTQQYRTMEIARDESGTDRVVLKSSAAPMLIAVVKSDGRWKVDAGPIIVMRKSAEAFKRK